MITSVVSTIAPLGHRNKILREIKRIKTEELDGTIPDEFLCPITREIMSDPVLAAGKGKAVYVSFDIVKRAMY